MGLISRVSSRTYRNMRLRNGKVCYRFDICDCGQNVNLSDYTPPRVCKMNSILKSTTAFIDQQTNQPPKDDTLWSKTDSLLDQITELLTVNAANGIANAFTMTFTEHCNQLELCNKILRKLQVSTEANAKFVVKTLGLIENCYKPLLPMCVFLKSTKDQKYKKLLKQEVEVGRSPFYLLYCLKKLRKLYENRLKIAEKYCLLTRRTADLVRYAVEMLRQRYENFRNNQYDSAPDKGSNEEGRRRSLIEKSIKPFSGKLPDSECCAICLAEMKTDAILDKPVLENNELAQNIGEQKSTSDNNSDMESDSISDSKLNPKPEYSANS